MKKIAFLVITLVSFNLVLAQNSSWENYVKPEIIHDYVEVNNEIWFSTNAGVVQVDKSTLQKTYFNRASANIPSNFVEAITKDDNNNIWIGTYNQAIAKFDGTDWTNYSFSHLFPNPNQPIETYCIEVDNQDIVWVGTNKGLLRFDGTNWQKYDSQNVDIMFEAVWAMTFDHQNNLFIATNNVFKFDGTNFTNISSMTGITLYGDADLLTDANGNIWVNNTFSAIGKYDGVTWIEYSSANGQLPFGSYYTIGETPMGEVFYTSAGGKYVLQNGTWTQNNIDASIPLNGNNLTTYFYDSQGTEWLANDDVLYQKNSSTITSLDLKGQLLNNNEFNAVEIFNNLKYFVTNESIYTFDGSTWNEFSFPAASFGNSYTLKDIKVVDTDNIWILSDDTGVMNWDGTNWTVYNSTNSNLLVDYLEDMVYDAATQTLWLVMTQHGLAKFDGTDWTIYDSSNTPMADNDLRIVSLDNNGNVYTTTAVSVGNIEVWRFDGTTWTDLGTNINAPQDAVRAIHFDKDNALWAGVGDNLIYKYTDSGWESWDLATAGLPGYRVYDIESDDEGNIYVATYNGAAKFDGTIWTTWTTENSGICWNRIYDLEMANNKLWFATHHGISAVQFSTTNTSPIISQNQNINVYPNPIVNNAIVQFTTTESTERIALKIISLDGRIVQEVLINGNRSEGEQQLEIQKENLSSGMYYLQVRYNNKQMTKTILIK